MAIGIGANTAIFSVVNGVLLRPLPYPEPDRLFTIAEVVPKISQLYPRLPANLSHFYEWRKRCSSLERLSAMQALSLNLTGSEQPELLKAARVSANILDVLGVRPQLGRTFLEEEDPDGRDRVVILADSVWKRRFSADPSIVGSKIMLDGSPHLVIGVLRRMVLRQGMLPVVRKNRGQSRSLSNVLPHDEVSFVVTACDVGTNWDSPHFFSQPPRAPFLPTALPAWTQWSRCGLNKLQITGKSHTLSEFFCFSATSLSRNAQAQQKCAPQKQEPGNRRCN